jgi:hypothetical protein
MSSDDTRVTSYNQSGGITAHTVNIGSQRRSLSNMPKLRASLLADLPRDKPIDVEHTFGDAEAANLADEIYEFLRVNAFKLAYPAPSQRMIHPRPKGVGVIKRTAATAPLRLFVGATS